MITIPQFFLSMWSRDPAEISRFLSSEACRAPMERHALPGCLAGSVGSAAAGETILARGKPLPPPRPQMENNVQADPTRGVPLSFLAIVDAGLGRAEQALEEATRACELSSFKKNNIEAVTARYGLAVVYAWTGHNDLAIAELSKLVDRPSGGNEGAILPFLRRFSPEPALGPVANRSCLRGARAATRPRGV